MIEIINTWILIKKYVTALKCTIREKQIIHIMLQQILYYVLKGIMIMNNK